MAAAAAISPTFPLFPNLPQELRDQIWQDALPDKVGPALFFYKKGCWCPGRLAPSDEGHDPENDENNLTLEFRPDLLDATQFEMPLVFVNREARHIALSWLRQHGVQVRPREDRQRPLFVRPFDPVHDALYIALEEWEEFVCEAEDRLSQPDLFDRLVDIEPHLTRIAVPETLLLKEAYMPSEMFRNFFKLKALLVVVDAPPDLQSDADNDVKVQPRLEFESTEGEALRWDHERGGFDSGAGEHIGDESLYGLMEETSKGLSEGLAQNHIRSFEIRPVFAVRK